MEQKLQEATNTNEEAADGTVVLEPGPFDGTSLHWTRGAGLWAVVNTSTNRSVGTASPIYIRVFNDVYEVKPSSLYLELEMLPLEGASDDVLRAFVALREQVIEDLKERAWDELEQAMKEN
jgi:hypothetical protein